MSRSHAGVRSRLVWRSAPVAFVAILGVGVAACGSSGGTTRNQAPAASTPATATPTAPPTTVAKSGGAGF